MSIEPFLDRILTGDCISIMRAMPANSIDLAVFSPPYNVGMPYDVHNDNMVWDEYVRWARVWIYELRRVMKPEGRVALDCLLEMGIKNNTERVSPYAEFHRIFCETGLHPFGSPVWTDKHRVKYTAWGSWMSPNSPYIYCPFEIVLLGYKERWALNLKGKGTISKEEFMMACSGVWDLPTQTKNIEDTKANFHLDLPRLCIKLLTFPGAVVLDPFVGSGQTAVAAKELGRRYIGIDISPAYCETARRRVENSSIQEPGPKDRNETHPGPEQ